MSDTSHNSGAASSSAKPKTSLARNKACICCRKKKMRCDGVRPVCTPCEKSNRQVDCAYEEKKTPNRTQLLESKVSRLEARLLELESSTEDPQSATSSSRSAFDPSPSPSSSSSSYVQTSPDSQSRSPVFASPITTMNFPPDNSDLMTQDERISLVTAFLTRQHQWNSNTDPQFLLSSPAVNSTSSIPHPALLNAIYLISSTYFPISPRFTLLRDTLLQRTLSGISRGLEQPNRLTDIIRASCLLSSFFYTSGRIQEGYFHSSAAVRLAGTMRFNCKICMMDVLRYQEDAKNGKPETLSFFCQLFTLDKGWSVATGLPSALEDDDIWTLSNIGDGHDLWAASDTESAPSLRLVGLMMLKLKACAFYELSNRITAHTDVTGDQLRQEQAVNSLSNFIHKFLPFTRTSPGDAPISSIDAELIAIHTLMYTAVLYLERKQIERDPTSFRKCMVAINSITAILHQIGAEDYRHLDPLLSSCWLSTGQLCVHVIRQLPQDETRPLFYQYLDTIISSLKRFGVIFPCADSQARVLEQSYFANGLRG